MEKRIFYVLSLFLFACMQTVKAQTLNEIIWFNYSVKVDNVITEDEANPIKVLLFNRSAAIGRQGVYTGLGRSNSFVANGKEYGMQGTMSNIGNRFYITKAKDKDGNVIDGYYNIHSYTENKVDGSLGNCIAIHGTTIFMDRAHYNPGDDQASNPYWEFTPTSEEDHPVGSTEANCGYTIKNHDVSDAYLYYNSKTKVVDYTQNAIDVAAYQDEWCIITEETYRNAIINVAENSYVEATGTIHDAGFNRFNDYEMEWTPYLENGNEILPKDVKPDNPQEGWALIDYYGYNLPVINNIQKNDDYISTNNWIADNVKELLQYHSHTMGAAEMDRRIKKAGLVDYGKNWQFWQKYGDDFCAGVYAQGGYRQDIYKLPVGKFRVVCSGFNTSNSETKGSLLVNGHKIPLPVLTESQREKFENYKAQVVADAKEMGSGLTDDYYYQELDGIAAAMLLSDKDEDLTADFWVEITEDDVKSGKNTISIGFCNNAEGDEARDYPVFADNFRLYFSNIGYVTYLSANNPDEEKVDVYAYEKPVDLYLRRAFTPGWNAIVLPFDITAGGLTKDFGENARLSKLEGVNPDRPSQIKFVYTETLKAGECGLVYVGEGANPYHRDPAKKMENPVKILTSPITTNDAHIAAEDTKFYGPIYRIIGVTRSENVSEGGERTGYKHFDKTVTNTYVTTDGENTYTLNFEGYYCKPKNGTANVAWPKNSYIVDGGNMYYLTEEWGVKYATMWYLQDLNSTDAKTFEINGVADYTVTEISGIAMDANKVNDGKIYNINGQYVGATADNLPKGLYIVNGKKFVVK